jgi:Zn-dependent protease with chaperone function
MPFLLLLMLMLVCMPVAWKKPPDWLGDGGAALFTWGGAALVVLAAAGLARWTRRTIARTPYRRDVALQRHLSGRFYHLIGQFVLFGLDLFVIGWGAVAQELCYVGPPGARWLLPGTEVIILAPFLFGLVLSWACFYDADRALHDSKLATLLEPRPFWDRWAYVGFHIRTNLVLVLIPIGMVILQEGLQRLFPWLQDEDYFPYVGVGVLAAAFLMMPWVVRLVLGLRPLEDGPLRQRLLRTGARLRFRCSNILLWPTRRGMANAMVVGLVPFIRYVVLTDRLIEDLTPEEVEAVFGHEVGHVKHRHMLYYLGFILVSLMVLMSIWQAVDLGEKLNWTLRQDLAVLPMFGLLGTYIFVVFGFLSRRCERQADVFGCRAVSCMQPDCGGHDEAVALSVDGRGLCVTGIHTFINALEKVAELNGISRDRPGWLQSWQHSTIARRVAFLQRVAEDPAVERRFQWVVWSVKWAFFLALVGVLVALGTTLGWSRIGF